MLILRFLNASLILCSFSSILLANPGGMRLRGLDDERQHSKLWTVQLLEHVLPSIEHGVMAQPCFHHMHSQPCTWNAAGALRSCPLPVHRTLPSPGKRKEFSLEGGKQCRSVLSLLGHVNLCERLQVSAALVTRPSLGFPLSAAS